MNKPYYKPCRRRYYGEDDYGMDKGITESRDGNPDLATLAQIRSLRKSGWRDTAEIAKHLRIPLEWAERRV